MARYTEADCRQCRRENQKLFLKGDRCYSQKCALTRRAKIPGQQWAGRKKQFHKYYLKADSMKGITGTNMLVMLEERLDNVVYRMGIGVSRSQSRQLVNHGHITVNGKTLNIPSYQVKVGDVIGVKENKQDNKFFSELKQMKKPTNLPKWLDFDTATLSGKIISKPQREDIDMNIQEHMIVELYSK